jgi:hypothetical protein
VNGRAFGSNGCEIHLALALPDELIEAIAQRAAEIVLAAQTVPVWLTLDEASERLRLSPAALRKRAQRGTAPGAVKDGSRWLFDARALEAGLGATVDAPDNNGASAAETAPPRDTGGRISHAG